MISKQWRTRLAWIGMSAFVAWHTFAMVVAPAPESHSTDAFRAIVQPYLTLFRLDNNWGFFAPDVPRGWQFRYTIEDANGAQHTFIPENDLNRFHPNSIWFKDRYKEVLRYPETFGETVGLELCRTHAALKPVSVTLLGVDQRDFSPDDRLDGKDPLDDEFIETGTLRTVKCPSP